MSASRQSESPSAENPRPLAERRAFRSDLWAARLPSRISPRFTVWAALGIALLFLIPTSMSLGEARTVPGLPTSSHPVESPAAELAAARLSASHGEGPGRSTNLPAVPHSATTPSVDYSLSMVYDAADGYVVAVDPNSSGGLRNTTYGTADVTWVYSGGNWSIANTTGAPPELLYPGLVYDAADGYVLLFGGLIIAGTQGVVTEMIYSNQTWSYAAGVWTNRTSPTGVLPPADSPILMAYDGADGYVVLLDEAVTAPDTMAPTTWSYLAGSWTNISGPSSAPALPDFGAMSYDAADGYIVAFGELTSGPGIENWTTLPITWEFAAGVWANVTASVTGAPPGRIAEGMTYDSSLGEVIMFGGFEWHGPGNYSLANDTWAYSAGNWTNLKLSAPGADWLTVALVFDPATGQLLLAVEGNNTTSSLAASAIWDLANTTWTPLAPLLLFGGAGTDVGVPFGLQVRTAPHEGPLSYRYSNLPPGCVSVNAPSLSCTTQASGRYVIGVTVNDTIGDSTNLATTVVVNPRPLIESFGASSPLSEVGVPISLAAVASGGTGILSYAYSALPSGCTSRDTPVLVCTPSDAGTSVVIAQVSDSLGVLSSSSLTVEVAARPSVTTFVAVPDVLDAGQTTVFAALTTGGVGPDAYAYVGLPAACPTVDQLSFGCTPQVAGSYLVSFAETDSFGVIATGASSLLVNPLPTITTFQVSSPQVTVGAKLDFSLAMAGGTAPYSYLYSGLPAGCASSDAATLSCTATAAGNYTVSVTVIDATGASAALSTTVEVSSLPATHPTSPGNGLLTVAPAGGNMFWTGLLVGSLALGAVAWLARRQVRVRAQGEAIIAQLQGAVSSSDAQPSSGPSRGPSPPDVEREG